MKFRIKQYYSKIGQKRYQVQRTDTFFSFIWYDWGFSEYNLADAEDTLKMCKNYFENKKIYNGKPKYTYYN